MTQPSEGAPSGPLPTLFEAIVRLRVVTATYNRGVVTLAPHILYTRHDEMFIDAVTTDRNGVPPRELKLGTFKLVGLSDIQVLDQAFEAMYGLYNETDDKYKGKTLFAVTPESQAA